MANKEVPYKLLIHTDSYSGNFDRQLVAYCFGILDEFQKNNFKEYLKGFWNKNYASDINTLEEALECEKEDNELFKEIEKILSSLNSEKGRQDISNEKKENWLNFYKEYLCETYQQVDDWEQNTFYNICSFYKNKEYKCDCVFIQLNKPLTEKLEDIFINQIKNFFDQNVLYIIKNYIYLCNFGNPTNSLESIKLLDLELVDKDNNIIKKYI